jgi:hypothetical protein
MEIVQQKAQRLGWTFFVFFLGLFFGGNSILRKPKGLSSILFPQFITYEGPSNRVLPLADLLESLKQNLQKPVFTLVRQD